MTAAIVAAALAAAGLNGAAAALGGWLWYVGQPSVRGARAFWMLLRIGQGSALTLVLAAGSLAAAGNYSRDHLFYLYALLPIAVALIGEQWVRVAGHPDLELEPLPPRRGAVPRPLLRLPRAVGGRRSGIGDQHQEPREHQRAEL